LFLVYVILSPILEVFDEHDAAKAFNFAAFLFILLIKEKDVQKIL